MKKSLCFVALLGLAGLMAAPAQEKPPVPVPAKTKHPRGYKPMSAAKAKALHDAAFRRHGHMMKRLSKNVTPPATFDCTANGWVGPVVDQGSCGDCYGVSSSDAMTGAFIKQGYGKADGSFKISDQYGLDCGAYEGGCGGGDEAQVIDLMKSTGFPAERWIDASGTKQSDYGPYTASPGRCQLKTGAKLWKLQDWGYVAGDQGQGPATLAELKAALMTYGQLSIALDASTFDNYSGGVIKNLGNSIDHAVTLVGWDDSKNAVKGRNNWGTGWGEQGYFWVDYGAVNQIVEPIWLLAPPLTPPTPGPTPPPPPGPTPPPPGPIPGVPVTVTLTPDQVASVIAQSGAVTITSETTVAELMDALKKLADRKAGKCCGQGPTQPDAIEKVMADIQQLRKEWTQSDEDLRRAISALLDAALREKK